MKGIFMSKIATIKKKIADNLPTITVVTVATATVAVVAYSVAKQIKATSEAAAIANQLNDGLADGSLTMLVQEGIGIIDIVETASI
jgi:hypothetical protein